MLALRAARAAPPKFGLPPEWEGTHYARGYGMQELWLELGGGFALSGALQVLTGRPLLRAIAAALLPVVLGVVLIAPVVVNVGEWLVALLVVLLVLTLALVASRLLPQGSRLRRYRPLALGALSTLLVAGGLIHF